MRCWRAKWKESIHPSIQCAHTITTQLHCHTKRKMRQANTTQHRASKYVLSNSSRIDGREVGAVFEEEAELAACPEHIVEALLNDFHLHETALHNIRKESLVRSFDGKVVTGDRARRHVASVASITCFDSAIAIASASAIGVGCFCFCFCFCFWRFVVVVVAWGSHWGATLCGRGCEWCGRGVGNRPVAVASGRSWVGIQSRDEGRKVGVDDVDLNVVLQGVDQKRHPMPQEQHLPEHRRSRVSSLGHIWQHVQEHITTTSHSETTQHNAMQHPL